jgi:hypothetical protein
VVLLDAGIQCGGLILDVVEKWVLTNAWDLILGDSGPRIGEELRKS